ncbi:MAG: hypothetical protein RIC03_07030 [Cyclobacteriaceae bacterium]
MNDLKLENELSKARKRNNDFIASLALAIWNQTATPEREQLLIELEQIKQKDKEFAEWLTA